MSLPLFVILFAAPVAAGAHGLGTLRGPSTCTHPKPYPPSPDATVESSTTTPVVSQHIETSGVGYCPNEDVTIVIAGQTVGTAHTDAAGAFDPDVVVPGPAGTKQLCGIGASGLSTDRDCLTLTVRAAGESASTQPGTSGSGNGPAVTGVEVAFLCAVALLLVAGGVAFSTAGRTRKSVVRP